MTRFGWITTSIVMLLCAGILLLVVVLTSHRSPATSMATTTPTSVPLVDPSTLAIYTSGTYGFSFFYPALATVTDQFSSTTNNSGLAWRDNAVGTGTLIARVQADVGEVRIGTSAESKEVAACTTSGLAEHHLPDTNVGSTTWKTFSFDKLGTDSEQHVTSYRTVHDNACFALETFEPRASVSTTTQAELDSLVQSFTFAHS